MHKQTIIEQKDNSKYNSVLEAAKKFATKGNQYEKFEPRFDKFDEKMSFNLTVSNDFKTQKKEGGCSC